MNPSVLPQDIQNLAYALVKLARNAGVVLTIKQAPLKPLAMGNYDSVVEIRPILERE